MKSPATPSETLATKVILGNLVVEIARLNENLGRCEATLWTESFRGRVLADLSRSNIVGGEHEGVTLITDALRIASRFFDTVACIQKIDLKAATG